MGAMNRLSVKGALSLGAGKHADSGGLRLAKDSQNRGKWFLRVTIHSRRREMSLGAFPAVFYQRVINATEPDQQVQKVA